MDRDELDDDVFEQLDAQDTLDDTRVGDPLDEGYSPAEKPWAVDDWGTTERETAEGESLTGRLARELPDFGASDLADDGLGDQYDTDGELRDAEVGDRRSGRLAELGTDLAASDVGIDGAGASAEEAAVHIVPDDE
jgi:Family of unknown function (DUF5709)